MLCENVEVHAALHVIYLPREIINGSPLVERPSGNKYRGRLRTSALTTIVVAMSGNQFIGMPMEEVLSFYGEGGTENVDVDELKNWFDAIATAIGKPKLAKEANQYAAHLQKEGFDTREDALNIKYDDLVNAGMRTGDANAAIRVLTELIGTDDSTARERR